MCWTVLWNVVFMVLLLLFSSSRAAGCPLFVPVVSGVFPASPTPVSLERQDIHFKVLPDLSTLGTEQGRLGTKVEVRASFALHNPTPRAQTLTLLSPESFVGCNDNLAEHDSSGTEFWLAGIRVARYTRIVDARYFQTAYREAKLAFQKLKVYIPARATVMLEKRFTVVNTFMLNYFLTEGTDGNSPSEFWGTRHFFPGSVHHSLVTLEFSYPVSRWAFRLNRELVQRGGQYRWSSSQLKANRDHSFLLEWADLNTWNDILAARRNLEDQLKDSSPDAFSVSEAYLRLGTALRRFWSYPEVRGVFEKAVHYAQKYESDANMQSVLGQALWGQFQARYREECSDYFQGYSGCYAQYYDHPGKQKAFLDALERVHRLSPENETVGGALERIRPQVAQALAKVLWGQLEARYGKDCRGYVEVWVDPVRCYQHLEPRKQKAFLALLERIHQNDPNELLSAALLEIRALPRTR